MLSNVSPAWYTWLEQGRGGTPSADVLDRLAKGLRLTGAEREHLYLLAQNRPPELVPQEYEAVEPRLHHILDSLEPSPAFIRSAAWDILAANLASRVIWGHGETMPVRYNALENFFTQSGQRGADHESAWTSVARAVVAEFRTEAVQSGFGPRAQEVVDGLLASSPVFGELWKELDVGLHLAPIKTFALPGLPRLTFELNTLSVDDHPGLKLVIFTPASSEDRRGIEQLIAKSSVRNGEGTT